MSMTSDTSLRLWRSAADLRSRSPSSPSPWKLYGLLRGLNAPPRRIFAPARFTAAALASTCSSLSAEQGPAMTMTSSPPIRTSPIVITVFSVLNERLASLYGSVIRCTSWTPSRTSSSAVSNWRDPPTAPSTVRSAPLERCTSKPISVSFAMALCTCASLARSRITTTMSVLFLLQLYFVGDPFQMPGFVDDPFEQALDRRLVERSLVQSLHVREHLGFAFGLVDRDAHLALQQADPVPQVLEVSLHACPFSHRTYAPARPATSGADPCSAMTFTSALPTTAASAPRPTS